MKKVVIILLLFVTLKVNGQVMYKDDVLYLIDGIEATLTYFTDNNITIDTLFVPPYIAVNDQEYPVRKIAQQAFNMTKHINNIVLPHTIDSIGYLAMSNCANLLSVNIPEGIKILWNGTFRKCKSLQSIKLPESLVAIDSNVLYRCTDLKEIIVPDSVVWIGKAAFAECSGVKRIVIGKSVRLLKYHALSMLEGIKEVEMRCATPPVLEDAPDDYLAGKRLIVPAGSEELYRQHPFWGMMEVVGR